MSIIFIALAWLGLMSVFAFVLLLIITVLIDPKDIKG